MTLGYTEEAVYFGLPLPGFLWSVVDVNVAALLFHFFLVYTRVMKGISLSRNGVVTDNMV